MSSLITRLIAARWFGLVARIALTFMFWASGIAKLVDFDMAMAEMAHFGLFPAAPFALAVALTQLIGATLIIANRWTWLGAGMLGVFTALTIPIAHPFWTMEEPMRTLEFYVVMEHLTVIGALMVVAWKSAPDRRPVATAKPSLAAA